MPPDTPKEMVAVIRHAFDATLKDPDFLADAEKALLEVDPVTGEEMEQTLKRAYASPKALVQKAAEFSGGGAQ
jgi:tripartite-type tricarboxylate transporter receptor subunit TctC